MYSQSTRLPPLLPFGVFESVAQLQGLSPAWVRLPQEWPSFGITSPIRISCKANLVKCILWQQLHPLRFSPSSSLTNTRIKLTAIVFGSLQLPCPGPVLGIYRSRDIPSHSHPIYHPQYRMDTRLSVYSPTGLVCQEDLNGLVQPSISSIAWSLQRTG